MMILNRDIFKNKNSYHLPKYFNSYISILHFHEFSEFYDPRGIEQ